MKRLLTLMLAGLLLLSLTACGGNESDNSPDNNDEKNNTEADVSDIEDNSHATPPNKDSSTVNHSSASDFEENKDLKIVAAFNYENDTYIVTENVGDTPILNYSVVYINFDNNGFVTTTDSDGYEGGSHEAANLMPGEKDIAAWFGATGTYAVATVYSVDYSDGTHWEASRISSWVEKQRTSFNVDNCKANIAAMKDTAALAGTNEYATLIDFSMVHGNRFSTDLDLEFTIKNTASQGINSLNVFVLEFDENGFPVSVSPYDTYCLNGHQTGGSVNLAPGQTGEYTVDLFISGSTAQLKVIISYIEFQDGTTWQNPYLYEWIIANNSAY